MQSLGAAMHEHLELQSYRCAEEGFVFVQECIMQQQSKLWPPTVCSEAIRVTRSNLEI